MLCELKPQISFVVFYDTTNNCWSCHAHLDFEDRFFDNRCNICNSSQGYDLEDFE